MIDIDKRLLILFCKGKVHTSRTEKEVSIALQKMLSLKYKGTYIHIHIYVYTHIYKYSVFYRIFIMDSKTQTS